MAAKTAVVVAATVEVQCPHCGEPQPNPDNGGHAWTSEEVRGAQGARACTACDAMFRIVAQSRVSVQS